VSLDSHVFIIALKLEQGIGQEDVQKMLDKTKILLTEQVRKYGPVDKNGCLKGEFSIALSFQESRKGHYAIFRGYEPGKVIEGL